jgi:hypothetical protein
MPKTKKQVKTLIGNLHQQSTSEELYRSKLEDSGLRNTSGRRLIALKSLVEFVSEINKHSQKCKTMQLNVSNECLRGLNSKISVVCSCEWTTTIDTDTPLQSLTANQALVWGCQSAAIGYSSARNLLTSLDLPTPTFGTYQGYEKKSNATIHEALEKELRLAGKAERELAIQAGDYITVEGVEYPWTTVTVDGGWCKRSYGHSYTAPCGVGVIIGMRSK